MYSSARAKSSKSRGAALHPNGRHAYAKYWPAQEKPNKCQYLGLTSMCWKALVRSDLAKYGGSSYSEHIRATSSTVTHYKLNWSGSIWSLTERPGGNDKSWIVLTFPLLSRLKAPSGDEINSGHGRESQGPTTRPIARLEYIDFDTS